jgi:hypothetical protein
MTKSYLKKIRGSHGGLEAISTQDVLLVIACGYPYTRRSAGDEMKVIILFARIPMIKGRK